MALSLHLLVFLIFYAVARDLDDIPTHSCDAPKYSGHDRGYEVLTAAGAGTIFGSFSLEIIGFILKKKKPKRKIPVVGWKLKDLTIPSFALGGVLFVFGVPMLVTGGYYMSWHRIYDVSGGCSELIQVEADLSALQFNTAFNTPINMTIAYVGNSGAKEESLRVWQMIADEGVEAVIHTGNFDMCDDSTIFREQIDEILGDILFIPVVGNIDLHVWEDYQEVLFDRWNANSSDISEYLQCEGTLFVNYWCVYRGLFIAFSSVGTKCGDGYRDHTWHEDKQRTYLERSTFVNFRSNWVTCAWHKNQHDLQIGGKGNEVGYEMYRICAQYRALTVTSHDFHYARSHALSEFDPQVLGDDCTNEDGSDICTYNLENNETIVVVSGLGGFKVKEEPDEDLASNEWWASTYHGTGGALICKYNYNGDENLAYCYFMTTDGDIQDEFFYTRGYDFDFDDRK